MAKWYEMPTEYEFEVMQQEEPKPWEAGYTDWFMANLINSLDLSQNFLIPSDISGGFVDIGGTADSWRSVDVGAFMDEYYFPGMGTEMGSQDPLRQKVDKLTSEHEFDKKRLVEGIVGSLPTNQRTRGGALYAPRSVEGRDFAIETAEASARLKDFEYAENVSSLISEWETDLMTLIEDLADTGAFTWSTWDLDEEYDWIQATDIPEGMSEYEYMYSDEDWLTSGCADPEATNYLAEGEDCIYE